MADIIKEIDDKFIASKNFDVVNIAAFIRKAEAIETRQANGVSHAAASTTFSLSGPEAFLLLYDTGNGRLTKGLLSLEMMSRVLDGVPLNSLSLFDAAILFYSPEEMKAASDATARIIILTNLGITPYYNAVKDLTNPEVAKYNVFLDNMSRQIKSGSFKTSDAVVEALGRTKIIIRLAMNLGTL